MMEYTEAFTLASSDFDEYGNIFPGRVLALFETAANHHAVLLGIDHTAMAARGFLWVVTQIKYQILSQAAPDTELKIKTWPLPPDRLGYRREYLVTSADGKALIKATSNWVFIDIKNRRLAKTFSIYPEASYCTEQNFSERPKRLRDFEADSQAFLLSPDQSAIDFNGHVNNTKYADFILCALQSLGGKVAAFQIDYHREVMCGQSLRLYHAKSGNTTLVKGLDEGDRRMFTCSFTIAD